MKTILSGILFLMMLQYSGCGSTASDQPDLGTVTGTVTINGKPAENVAVYFNPIDSGRPSTGVTNQSGEYTLVYSAKSLGAKTGAHIVTIASHSSVDQNAPITEMPSSEGSLPKEIIDIKKTVEVKPGKNVIDLVYP